MTDREKVRKGLEWILDGDRFGFGENWHIDSEPKTEEEQAGYYIQRAIELLKEQEAQSVLSNRVCEAEPFRYVRKGFCPKCHQEMEWLFNRKHCGFCGQAVKWDA